MLKNAQDSEQSDTSLLPNRKETDRQLTVYLVRWQLDYAKAVIIAVGKIEVTGPQFRALER